MILYERGAVRAKEHSIWVFNANNIWSYLYKYIEFERCKWE